MWAPRDTSAGTPEASSPRHVARGVADADTDVPGGRVDALPFSEASRGRRREDENETEDWCVGGFDVFERRTSPLRRKRAPLVPSEFDHDALVRRALEQARGGEKGVGPAHLATRAPLRALVPGNASLHRRAEEASVRERARRGLSFDTRGDPVGGTATPATTPSVAFASEPRPSFVKRSPRSANAAEGAPKPSPPRTPASRENRATASANGCSSRDSLFAKSDSLFVSPACSEASEASSFWSAEKKQHKRENGVSVTSLSVTEAANAQTGSESVASQVLDRNRDEDRNEEDLASLRARVHARRRHRKRLAVIVVAQWRWFARDALESLPARMHAAWRRKRNAMREWRRVAGEEVSFAALRAVAAERERRLAKTLRAFTHRREREERKVSRDVPVLDTIRSDGNDATDASATDASASRDHSSHVCFLQSFQSAAENTQIDTMRSDDSAYFVASATAAAVIAFRRWRRFAKTRVAKRARRRERVSLADARAAATRTKKARASLRLWRDVARFNKTRRVAATRVVTTAKVFFRRNRLSRAFVEWRLVTRDALLTTALFVARLDRDRAFRFALRALDAWQDASRVQRTKRVTVERAWNAWDALARRARWRLGVAASHEAAAACEKTRAVARAWRNVAKAKSQKRVKAESALTFRKTHDTKRLLLCFRAAFIEPSLEARAARCADAFFDRTRARLALRAWRAENAATFRTLKKFASRRASSILALIFGAWRGPFLRRARLRRLEKSKLARALATRHALVTCRAFIGWSYRARVVGRSKRRCAADATRHRRAFLVTAAFTEWVARVQDARSLDALSDAKLETARAALGATKTARVFDAWLERTKTKLARRAVVTYAERRCVHAVFTKTVAAWRNRVLVKRASRDAYARATNHYDTRRLAFDSMEAWVLVLCASRLRRAKTQKADAFRSRVVLKRRVFPAWIAFVAVKKKRRDEIRDALAAFKADATRAGCAAWLREGLRRRELRREQSLSFVADEAARRSAEIWRVVGRFARRWLRVTRRRARRRKEKQSRLFDATVFPISAATEPHRAATETYGDPTEVCTVESRRTTVSAGESVDMDVTQEPPPVFHHSSKETRSASTRNAFPDVFEEGKDSYGNHQSDEVYRVSAAVVAPRRRRPPRRLDAGGGGVPPRAAAPPSTVSIPSTASIGRPPKRSGSLSFGAAAMDARLDARTDAGQFQSGDHQMILNRENVNALLLSPARLLDAHERCICEFEALKAESARIRDALAETDASLASNAITECVASVRKASLTTAAQATRRRRAELLPAVRAAAAALGEYRSDMATSVASGW